MRKLVVGPTPEEVARNAIYAPLITTLATMQSLWGRDEYLIPGLATKERTIIDREGRWALVGWRNSEGVIDRVSGYDLEKLSSDERFVFLWNLNHHVVFQRNPWPEDMDRFVFRISLLHTLAAVSQ